MSAESQPPSNGPRSGAGEEGGGPEWWRRLSTQVERNANVILVVLALLTLVVAVAAAYGERTLSYSLVVIVVLSTFVSALILIRTGWRRVVVLAGLALLSVVVAIVFSVTGRDPRVAIAGLSDGERVALVIDGRAGGTILGHFVVQGTFSEIGSGRDVYLLSGEPTKDEWWVWETYETGSGRWEGRVCVGFAEVGKTGYLLAVAVDRSRVEELIEVDGQRVIEDPEILDPVAESDTILITIGEMVEDPAVDPANRCQ